MNKGFFGRNSSTILTCIGAAGVIATAVMAVRATPKALKVIEEAEKEKGEALTKMEVVVTAAPAYIPAIVMGASTIACIFGANALNKRQQASMASAYAILNSSYSKYRDKVREICGEEVEEDIKEAIVDDICDDFDDLDFEDEELQLFYDGSSNNYFTASMGDVLHKIVTDDGLECYYISTPYDCPVSLLYDSWD